MTARGTWKASERRMALALGGRRVPVTGRQRGDAPDVEHPIFAIEHKYGRVLSPRLQMAVEQAVAAACGTSKLPLVTVEHANGRGNANGLYVLMRLEDWIAWNGPSDVREANHD